MNVRTPRAQRVASSCPSLAAALALMLAAGNAAHAQCSPELSPGPALDVPPFSLTNSLFINANVADSTEWDSDGAGPKPPLLVVGGAFTKANGGTANFVTAWDGAKPVGLGVGFDQDVVAVHAHNGILYAGGRFASSGSNTTMKIAQWNPTTGQWIGVGGGVSPNSVFALNSYNGQLVVAGEFGVVGTGPSAKTCLSGVALWNGSTWTPLGPATDFFSVSDVEVFQGQLYICGALNNGPSMTGVARWNAATQQWNSLSGGLDGPAFDLHAVGNDLFICGSFNSGSSKGVVNSPNFIRWDGTAFHKENFNINAPTPYIMNSMIDHNGQMIAIGKLQPNIFSTYRRDPSGWQVTAQYFDQPAQRLGKYQGNTIVMGGFKELTYAAGSPKQPLPGIARLDDLTPPPLTPIWKPLEGGFNGPILSMLSAGSTMYLGGAFSIPTTEGDTAGNVVATNGQAFSALKDLGGFTSVNGPAYALGFYSTNPLTPSGLIIGGDFDVAAGMTVNNIIQYKIGVWSKMGNGFNDTVKAVRQWGTTLYAAGLFTASGSTSISKLAKYSGGQWIPVANIPFKDIQALGVHKNKLIIGGVSGVSGGLDGVSSFDGSIVVPLGVANGAVNAIQSFEDQLIVAGAFSNIGGVACAGVARFDGFNWQPMAAGLGSSGVVNCLGIHKGSLYAGGLFPNSGATPMHNLARWNGAAWEPVEDGTNGPVFTMAPLGDLLHVGGSFTQADGQPAPSWATIDCICYPDCDASGDLGIDDFICFQTLFALGDPAADCDENGLLGIDDFVCFQTAFALGC